MKLEQKTQDILKFPAVPETSLGAVVNSQGVTFKVDGLPVFFVDKDSLAGFRKFLDAIPHERRMELVKQIVEQGIDFED